MLAFQWLIQKEKRPTKSLINCPRATGSDTWCHPLGVCRWLKSLAELHLHRAHTWARLKNKSEVSGRLTVLTTSFSHCVRRRSCSRSWSALQPPDTSGGEEKEKKKHFPEKHATQISYTIVHGRKSTHTFVCTKQNNKKNHVEAQRSGCIHVGALKFISKLKTRTEREREGDNLATTKSTCSLARQQLKVCGIRVRRQTQKKRQTHWATANQCPWKASHMNQASPLQVANEHRGHLC